MSKVLAATFIGIIGGSALYDIIKLELEQRRQRDSANDPGGIWNDNWDHFDASMVTEDAKYFTDSAMNMRKAMKSDVKTRRVVFVTIAQPCKRGKKRDASQDALSAIGKKQAALTGARLQDLFKDVKVGSLFHADAPEAKATAELMQKSLSPKLRLLQSPFLVEGTPVPGSPPLPVLAASEDPWTAMARAEAAFLAHIWVPSGSAEGSEADSVDIVVAYPNIIRYLLCRSLQWDVSAWSRLGHQHGAISWLDLEADGRVRLRECIGTGHLPADLLTTHREGYAF